MDTYKEMTGRQLQWAQAAGLRHTNGYCDDIAMNLFQEMSAATLADFKRGAGAEMGWKMRALHSSSALVCNGFDYWRGKSVDVVGKALGFTSPVVHLGFEATMPTGLRGMSPNLDVLLRLHSGMIWGIESKFTEPFASRTHEDPLREAYFPNGRPIWEKRGLPRCANLAQELRDGGKMFEHLDAAQLLKHVLGLERNSPDGFGLIYLYVEPLGGGAEANAHREEIDLFESEVRGDFPFKSISYSKLVDRFREMAGDGHEKYFDYMSARYGRGDSVALTRALSRQGLR